ncbi:penicillin-binding transpeptidase domain-containing protein [Microbulbifer sp. EKSA005]|uniref:penicillin-binding transpeptidase domain-containing protein n=1 Tax=Microbulbifer sp. EKSA005 TaxID=3243364 RepID=UPI0040414BA9
MKHFIWFITAAILVFGASNSVIAEGGGSCSKLCTFVLKNSRTSEYTVINRERVAKQFTPFSTFKVPNTLIALDLDLVENLLQELTYNHDKYPAKEWWPTIWSERPLTIREAFQNSAVPIYQQLATEIGAKRMNQYLAGFNYGNRDASSGIDTFWLNESIKISALEQVDFLERLFTGQLPVSQSAIDKFKEVMLVEETDAYKLYAKTGGGPLAKNKALGWYIGIVESNNNIHYFAINIDGSSFREVQKKRIEIARKKLSELGVI